MLRTSYEQRRRWENLDRRELETLQLARLNALLAQTLPNNLFLQQRLADHRRPLQSLEELTAFPYLTKNELIGGPQDAYAANRTFPLEQYVRFHRTSGTHGRPLAVLDTAEDWQWWIETWQFVLDAAELRPHDHVFMAFSFGPFIGFWSAHDAAVARGAMVIPGGGLNALARLDLMRTYRVTALFCTPSYALHLVEVAQQHDLDLASFGMRRIIVAGEPGGSLPATRDRIEAAWAARVIDHAGATEVGPWGYADAQRRGLRVVETEFLTEFRQLETGRPAQPGELAELVLTSLGRIGSPVIRYRTGDIVRPRWTPDETNQFVLLEEGVLGRVDDMIIVRGVNVFPSAIEQILRGFSEIIEYRVTASREGELDILTIEIEDQLNSPQRVVTELQLRLGLKVDVRCVPLGSLPRFESKAQRVVDRRKHPAN